MASECSMRRRHEFHAGSIESNTNISNNDNNNNTSLLHPGVSNNTHHNAFKFSNEQHSFSHQGSLLASDGRVTPPSQSRLAPPTLYARERSNSTSSTDSLHSQNSRRRLRRNSSSRSSDFHDDADDVTLMTFAHAVLVLYKKAGKNLQRLVNMLFVARPTGPKVVCEAEVMEQAGWICKDFVINRLTQRELMNRKVGLTPSDWPHSRHVIDAGSALEMTYPKTYSNVSRKLCMTMSSVKVVRTTLTLLMEVMFEGGITWGKVVSMFAVASLFAEECASQGHADFVQEVVDAVVDFTGSHLLPWLVSQGGWDAFPVPDDGNRWRLSKLRLLLVTGAATAIGVSSAVMFDLW